MLIAALIKVKMEVKGEKNGRNVVQWVPYAYTYFSCQACIIRVLLLTTAP